MDIKDKINNNILANTTILYLEDQEEIKNEVAEILNLFFKKAYVCENGEEGLVLYKKHQKEIDIILTDLNMPKLNGFDFIKTVRKEDNDIPILVVTGFRDSHSLIQLIKLNVTNYIVKPMLFNTTLRIISEIMENINNKKKVENQNYELNQFMSILDSKNLMCEFDSNLDVLNVNELFVACSEYSVEEVKDMKLNQLNDLKKQSKTYDLLNCIKNGKPWTGDLKKITKNGDHYYTNSTIVPIFCENEKIKKFIEFGTLTTKYETEIYQLRKHIMMLKSSSFKASIELKNENINSNKTVKELKEKIDETVNNSQQLLIELYDLKKENRYLGLKLKEQEKRFEDFQSELM